MKVENLATIPEETKSAKGGWTETKSKKGGHDEDLLKDLKKQKGTFQFN